MRSTSARSASVRPRSGARTSGPRGTPRKPSAVFDAAWKGKRCSWARSVAALSPASGVGSRTSGTTASGKLAASPETAPTAPAASPRSSSASAPTKTSRPSTRDGSRRPPRGTPPGPEKAAGPLEGVGREPLPRAVRALHPREVRSTLAQPLDHGQGNRVAAPCLELVEIERHRRAGTGGRLEVREQLALVEGEVRRGGHPAPPPAPRPRPPRPGAGGV